MSENKSHKKRKKAKEFSTLAAQCLVQRFDRFHCSTARSTDAWWKWWHAAPLTVTADLLRVREWGESGFAQPFFIHHCLLRSEGRVTSDTLFMATFTQDKELSDLTSRTKKEFKCDGKRFIQYILVRFADRFRVDCAGRFGVVILLLESTAQSGWLFQESIYLLLWWPKLEATAQHGRGRQSW